MIVRPPVAESRWTARAARARELAAVRPEARDALEFLARLTTLQQSLATQYRSADAALPQYLKWLATNAPAPVAQAATTITKIPVDPGIDTPEAFIVEALLQVYPPDPCRYCKAPAVSLLREAAHGSRRSHVCGVCLTESPASRLGCAVCGEQRVEALPIFRSEATEPARIDACDTCHTYVKTIDLTRDGSACAIADDVASISLDLWAREQGYHRARPNLLRL
jgi:formate dehydrogenase maturation protein FdhE